MKLTRIDQLSKSKNALYCRYDDNLYYKFKDIQETIYGTRVHFDIYRIPNGKLYDTTTIYEEDFEHFKFFLLPPINLVVNRPRRTL